MMAGWLVGRVRCSAARPRIRMDHRADSIANHAALWLRYSCWDFVVLSACVAYVCCLCGSISYAHDDYYYMR